MGLPTRSQLLVPEERKSMSRCEVNQFYLSKYVQKMDGESNDPPAYHLHYPPKEKPLFSRFNICCLISCASISRWLITTYYQLQEREIDRTERGSGTHSRSSEDRTLGEIIRLFSQPTGYACLTPLTPSSLLEASVGDLIPPVSGSTPSWML